MKNSHEFVFEDQLQKLKHFFNKSNQRLNIQQKSSKKCQSGRKTLNLVQLIACRFLNNKILRVNMYKQRLMKQAIEASKKKFSEFLLMYNEGDLLSWQAFIQGPKDTPYANYIFLVKINLTAQYPIAPPKMYFKTKIFHPNIHFITGEVCLDIIKTEWSPTWTLQALCRAIVYLLQNPNADSPLNCDAANLIRLKQSQAYATLAQSYASQFAISSESFQQRLKNYSQPSQ